jgi:Ca2+-binding RTX toxin-like protein
MFGGSGDDTLMDSSAGNDNLNGGYGNDILDSGAGNDTYVLRSGSGQDQISAYDSAAANIDTIQFEDVASTALRAMKRAGNDLILEYGESDAVKVKNFYEAYIGGCSLARLAA